jgi:hypothetical protein
MKYWTLTVCLFAILISSGCKNKSAKIFEGPKAKGDSITCSDLSDKGTILKIARALIKEQKNPHIWNLHEVDTTKFFTTEDYFTTSKYKTRIVLLGGVAGGSAGTEQNLLMLIECKKKPEVIWYEQYGYISASQIKDLTGDGIVEIIERPSVMWMGQCIENFDVFNLKNSKPNYLFSAQSKMICGLDSIGRLYNFGDTLSVECICTIIPTDSGRNKVQQIRTIKIHNGGVTDDEIMQQCKTTSDTSLTDLR